jgi:hypothetical protein
MNNNTYEKTRLKDKVKDILTLFIFIAISLIASLIVMDILIFPLALFSINNKIQFNHFIKHVTWITILVLLTYLIVRRIYLFRKNGMAYNEIIKNLIAKPLKVFITIFAFLIIVSLLIYLVYFLMSSNYYLLYKIINC